MNRRGAAYPPRSRGRWPEGLNLQIVAGLHLLATAAALLGLTDFALPFWTAMLLCAWMFFADRTIYFVYPGLMLMTLGFLSPLILFGAPIALKIPPNGSAYDDGMILSLLWFLGVFSLYVPVANKVRAQDLTAISIGKSDAVPILASLVLLVFCGLMLKDGTLLSGGYRDVTESRHGFIESSSLITLIGFCAARSRQARQILMICAAIYLATTFLVGLRLRFISVAVVVFCCAMGIRIHSGWKIAGLMAGLALFVLGMVRNSGFGGANLGSALSLESMYNQGALVSTPGGAFQTSKFQAYYVDYVASYDGISGIWFLIGDIAAVFITRGGLPGALEIKSQVNTYFDVPGGGVLPGYFFAYTGLFGAIVLSILFTMVFIWILRRDGAQAFPYQVLLAAYAPRMLLYDWTVGFKMMFYFLILKSILSFLVSVSHNAPGRAGSPRHKVV